MGAVIWDLVRRQEEHVQYAQLQEIDFSMVTLPRSPELCPPVGLSFSASDLSTGDI